MAAFAHLGQLFADDVHDLGRCDPGERSGGASHEIEAGNEAGKREQEERYGKKREEEVIGELCG